MREQEKIMEDFNERIGAGRGGDEVTNANGRSLLAWSTECDLAVLNIGDKCTGPGHVKTSNQQLTTWWLA